MGAFLTFLGLAIAVVIWWRRWTRAHKTVMGVLNKAEASLDKRAPKAPLTLEKDPKTGVYKPP
ncbi:MAG: hypothetical protein GY788_16495, partial [bacterium]|nr:hypothetical protein [bacterium]